VGEEESEMKPLFPKRQTVILKLGKKLPDRLCCFYGRMFLEPDEKQHRLSMLAQEIELGNVDKDILPYINRLNRIPHIMTTRSCSGYNGDMNKTPYIDFRWGLPFDELFERVHPLLSISGDNGYDVDIEITGWELVMPRFVFRMRHSNWRRSTEILIGCLLTLSPIRSIK